MSKIFFTFFQKKPFDCFSEIRYMRLISASHFRIVVNPWYSQKPQNRTQQQAQRSGANKQEKEHDDHLGGITEMILLQT
jgi:hypothetical protein